MLTGVANALRHSLALVVLGAYALLIIIDLALVDSTIAQLRGLCFWYQSVGHYVSRAVIELSIMSVVGGLLLVRGTQVNPAWGLLFALGAIGLSFAFGSICLKD
jgi:hypothetical protein